MAIWASRNLFNILVGNKDKNQYAKEAYDMLMDKTTDDKRRFNQLVAEFFRSSKGQRASNVLERNVKADERRLDESGRFQRETLEHVKGMYGKKEEVVIADMAKYAKMSDRHVDYVTEMNSKGASLITEEERRKAVEFYSKNPNYDITGKMGNADEIKRERKMLIIIGPAGSGKTYFATHDPDYREFCQTAVSIDPDKYRNASKEYGGGDYGIKIDETGKAVEDESRHDYTWAAATQQTQKSILGKYRDETSLFGSEIAKGSNIIYQTIGDNTSKITDLIDYAKSKGYRIDLVQNQLEEGIERLAENTAKRYKDGRGRMTPVEVSMQGFKSSKTFAQCVERYKKDKSVKMAMNLIKGKSLSEGKGSEKIRYGE